MLETEIEVKKYYSESAKKWNITRSIEIGDLSNQISDYILKKLNKNLDFKIKNLASIWKIAPVEYLSQNLAGGINTLTKIIYERDKEFEALYRFLCEKIIKMFNGDFVVQRVPTIRIHTSTKEDTFYPQWHSDLILGHPVGTTNIWIPLTQPNISEIHGFNLCEPETSYNFFKESSKLFSPYELLNNEKITKSKKLLIESNPINTKTGFATVFDSRCFHSALPIYQHTRVSMDLRLIDKKYLNSPYPSFTGRGRKKAKFDTKNFYTEI